MLNMNLSITFDSELHWMERRDTFHSDAESMDAIHAILSSPVNIALAATVDEHGNIDGRVCLVLPVGNVPHEPEEDEDEPWKASVPPPPPEAEPGYADEPGEKRRDLTRREDRLVPMM